MYIQYIQYVEMWFGCENIVTFYLEEHLNLYHPGQKIFFDRDSASTVTKSFGFWVFSFELLDPFGPYFDRTIRAV